MGSKIIYACDRCGKDIPASSNQHYSSPLIILRLTAQIPGAMQWEAVELEWCKPCTVGTGLKPFQEKDDLPEPEKQLTDEEKLLEVITNIVHKAME